MLVTGAMGMLAGHVHDAVKAAGHTVIVARREWLDIADQDSRAYANLRWTDDRAIDVVINCAGVASPGTPVTTGEQMAMVRSNALGPHVLALWCEQIGAKLVHVSTDCVFSGRRANDPHYENGLPDPTDLYGRSKLAGEVQARHVLNVRASFVGWEGGLLAWLAQQSGEVWGWAGAGWSGLYVATYARVLVQLAELFMEKPYRHGVIHVPGPHWRKLHLLEAVVERCGLPVVVMPVGEPLIYRNLSSLHWGTTGIEIPTWSEMLKEVKADYVRHAQAAATEDAKS